MSKAAARFPRRPSPTSPPAAESARRGEVLSTRIRRKRRDMEVPESSADLMSQVLARIGGSGRGLEFRVFEAYNGAVGEMLRRRTEPERLNGKTLQVKVASSALAHELTMLKREVLGRIALVIGADLVTDLRTRVG